MMRVREQHQNVVQMGFEIDAQENLSKIRTELYDNKIHFAKLMFIEAQRNRKIAENVSNYTREITHIDTMLKHTTEGSSATVSADKTLNVDEEDEKKDINEDEEEEKTDYVESNW
jgi:hypothetical protein